MLVPVESSSAVLVMISSKSVSICNRFRARRVNSCKITILGRTSLSCLRWAGISSPSATKFGHEKTRDSTLSEAEYPDLTWAWIGTGL